jgi:hypothetical protein
VSSGSVVTGCECFCSAIACMEMEKVKGQDLINK